MYKAFSAVVAAGIMVSPTSLMALMALALFAQLSAAQAEIIPFWEDSDKPSLTGSTRKNKSLKARAALREAGSDDDDRPARRASKRKTRVASRGTEDYSPRPPRDSVTGGAISWSASSSCLNSTLSSLVGEVAATYGSVTVTSTCRDRSHNAAVGGAKRSHHLTGDAVDFRVRGNVSGTIAYLRNSGSVGGFHHYGGGLIHIDTGPRRTS
jgi:hypothetical protein